MTHIWITAEPCPSTLYPFAGGIFGNGGGKGPSKKELDEFGEDEDNMLGKAEVPARTPAYLPQAECAFSSFVGWEAGSRPAAQIYCASWQCMRSIS